MTTSIGSILNTPCVYLNTPWDHPGSTRNLNSKFEIIQVIPRTRAIPVPPEKCPNLHLTPAKNLESFQEGKTKIWGVISREENKNMHFQLAEMHTWDFSIRNLELYNLKVHIIPGLWWVCILTVYFRNLKEHIRPWIIWVCYSWIPNFTTLKCISDQALDGLRWVCMLVL